MERTRQSQPAVQLALRLYPGQDDDLIRWLEMWNGKRYGAKSRAVREALRRGIAPENPAPAKLMAGHSTELMTGHPTEFMAEVRQVVEAAVASALGRFSWPYRDTAQGMVPGEDAATEDDEIEDLLAGLGQALVLEEE